MNSQRKEYLLDGDYVILDENKNDLIVFSDFGRKGLERSKKKISVLKDKSNLAGYGVLGSVRGIPFVIRNSLALKGIRNIFLVGDEIKPFFAFTAFISLLTYGMEKNKIIKNFASEIKKRYGMSPIIQDINIKEEIVEEFKKHINVFWINSLEEYSPSSYTPPSQERKKISEKMREINIKENQSKEEIKPHKGIMQGTEVYEETIENAHKLALLKILFSGHETDSQYGKTKEIINLMITVKNPYKELFGNRTYLEYGKDLVNPKLISDEYTYGRLLCNYKENFNQIKAIIKRLNKNLEDRAALASLWIPQQHLLQKSNQPCLTILHVLIRNNTITTTVYFRSNDMYKAWPTNIAGIAYINYFIWKELKEKFEELHLGMITTISGSAHIYEYDWKDALKKAMSYDKNFVQDKFGYFIISKEDHEYIAKIYENNGELLGEVKDACPIRLRKNLSRFFAISAEHASYVGEVLGQYAPQNDMEK